MKFVVSSTELLSHLQLISRVINSKNTLPILDNFLFKLHNNELKVTASDLESTMETTLHIENVVEEGDIAIPAKLLTDTLKEFPEQPLTFIVNPENLDVEISWEKGKFNIPGASAEDFPAVPLIKEESKFEVDINPDALLDGITKTVFATADDELRPVMNGINIDFDTESAIFVASDAHKLVRYKRSDVHPSGAASFILPKKPANLLKALLAKESNDVAVAFDSKNASFTLTNFKLVCRLVEGTYPAYNSVIPTNNPNKLTIDRAELLNCVRRVSVCSNQASNLIKLKIDGNQLTVSAQDLDFSISAIERLSCQYEGDNMEIGFKSTFLSEILANIESEEVVLELADPSRAGLILPTTQVGEFDDTLMLLMPMMINA